INLTQTKKEIKMIAPSTTDAVDKAFKTEVTALYKELIVNVPSIDQATFSGTSKTVGSSDVTVSMVMSTSDFHNKKDKSYMLSRTTTRSDRHDVSMSPFPVEMAAAIVSVSPSGRYMLSIKEAGENDFQMEIVDQGHIVRTINAKDVHKKIFVDEWFGRISWSPCEQYIAYIAERPLETTTFYDREPKEKAVGDSHVYRSDWGETYAPHQSPSIYVVDICNESIIPVLWPLSEALTAGQVIWTTGEAVGLVFIGWKVELRRFGIRACFNRLSSIYYVNFKDLVQQRQDLKTRHAAGDHTASPKHAQVTPVNLLGDFIGCFRSPRFSLDGKQLYFFGMPGIVLPHNSCSQLLSIPWTGGSAPGTPPVTIQIGERNFADKDFSGIYSNAMPANPWLTPNTLVFGTIVHSQNVSVAETVNGIDKFQIIHAQPKNKVPAPLILMPHGGPHVGSTCDYNAPVVFFLALGYAVTQINYRGSTGFGKDYVDVLSGKAGQMDVADCVSTLDYLLATRGQRLDRERVGVQGGSHGGFLAAHLSGLKDSPIKAAVIRNPVIDIAAMSTQSDIPDWCFFEAGIPLAQGARVYPTVPSLEHLEKMRKCSPIVNLDIIKTPTLLMLGENDLRCPPSQGLMLYNALNQKGVATKCLMYPKTGHGLASIDAKIDQWIHAVCWLKIYLP
ncbi:hypothetical protein SAMD00019534_089710, partial [Acytostelium subglobosum LB1]|uniref:hypothetical protein n=1 Tax=Acytostelium subglobosum LB1 TaxID=1410327 RepID=UPI000644CCB6